MNIEQLIDLNVIDMNKLILRNISKLQLTPDEVGVLLFLYDNAAQNNIELMSSKSIADTFSTEVETIKAIQLKLMRKGLFQIEQKQSDKGIYEILNFNHLVDMLSGEQVEILTNEQGKKQLEIATILEREFGRLLTPYELEYVRVWVSDYATDIIIKAIKEATINDVKKLTYIDKILLNWKNNVHFKKQSDTVYDETVDLDGVYFDWIGEK